MMEISASWLIIYLRIALWEHYSQDKIHNHFDWNKICIYIYIYMKYSLEMVLMKTNYQKI
jgi:hypothetical protein